MRIEEVHLSRRPDGVPAVEDFEIVGRESAEPRSGQIVVANRFFSIDPYMRGLVDDRPTYRAPFALHEVLDGPAVGEVVASTTDEIRIGDVVRHESGWRSHAVLDAADTSRVQPLDGVELSANLGVLGMPGFAAWLGLNVIGRFRPGQTVFVSSAAGAVGSLVG